MNNGLKARVVERLWELCEGAEYERSHFYDAVCERVGVHATQWLVALNHKLGLAVPAFDFGLEQRTLAGFLAAYIETEL